MNQFITNWRTTSAGLLTIVSVVVPLAFAVSNHTSTEGQWIAAFTACFAGIGLIFSGDAKASDQKIEQAKTDVKSAIDTGDTSHLTKPTDDA